MWLPPIRFVTLPIRQYKQFPMIVLILTDTTRGKSMAWQEELPGNVTKPLKIRDTYRGLQCWVFVPGSGFLLVRCTSHPARQQKNDPLGGRASPKPRLLVLWEQQCKPGGSTWHSMATGVPQQIHLQQWEHQEDQQDPVFWVDPLEFKPPKERKQSIIMRH